MKKLLLLLTALLGLGVSGAWAANTVYTVSGSNGTFYDAQAQATTTWGKYFKPSDEKITVTFAQGFGVAATELYAPTDDSEGTYTISVSGLGTIVSYSISGTATGTLTFTPNGGDAQVVADGGSADWSVDVNSASTSFKLQGGHISGVSFTITVKDETTVTLISGFSGTFYDSNFYYANGTQDATHKNWVAKCITNTTIPVTLDFGVNQSLSDWNCYFNVGANDSKVLTVSLPDGYAIKEYSFTATVQDNYEVTVKPRGKVATNFPYNESANISVSDLNEQSTTIIFTADTSSQCRVNVTNFTITIVAKTNIVEEGVYRWHYAKTNSYTCYVKSDFTVAKGKSGATADDGGDFLFTRVSGTNNTYYIRTLEDGGYLYAAGVGNVSASSPWQYDNAAAVSKNTSFDANDDKFKWIISETSAGSGKYYIRPKSNTKTAIAITSDNNTYLAFYDKTGGYDFAWATLTSRTLDNVIDLYPVKGISVAYDIDEIKTKKSYNTYVLSSSDQATYLGQTGFPTTAAYTTFTSTFTTTGTITAQAAIDGLLSSTLPSSGYYYIKNKGLSTYMFRDENYDTYTADATLLNEESRTSKYIWKVDISADGTTANVTSLTGKSVTAKDATPFARTDMSIKSAWLMNFASGYGAYYMGYLQDPNQNGSFTIKGSGNYDSATNPRRVSYWASAGGDRDNTKAYWTFEAVDEDDYDVYNVSITNAPGTNYVEYKGSSTTGNLKVFDGGCYFMTKDASVAEADFTPEAVAGYETEKTLEGKQLTINYFRWEDRINDYLTANNVEENVGHAGEVGYPLYDNEYAVALRSLLAVFEGGTYNSTGYTNLTTWYPTFLEQIEIVKPVEGKTYTIANYANNGTIRYLYNNEGEIHLTTSSTITDNYKFICHENADGKFIFAMPNGNYLVWKGNNTGVNEGKGQTTLTEITSDSRYPLTIQNFPKGTDSNNTATAEQAFGKVQIIGWRTDGKTPQNSSLIVKTSVEDTFDQAGATNFFTSTSGSGNKFSSAWIITEVDGYYNKVKLNSDGTNAYASLYLPFSVTIPSDITAYTVTSQDGEYAHMDEIVSNGTLPKETAAILKKDGQTTDETIYLSPAEEAGSNSTTPYSGFGGTVGTVMRATLGTGTTYVLGKRSSSDSEETVNIGLYNYTGTYLAKGKAYLFVAGGSTKALTFDFGDATAICSIDNAQLTIDNAEIYNLAGQRVNKAVKGLYIVNGKKVMVK